MQHGEPAFVSLNENSIALEISFDTKALRDTCESKDVADSEFGSAVGAKLRSRLADLSAASSVFDIIVGSPMEIEGLPTPKYKIELCDGFTITFSPNHKIIPNENGSVSWGKVNRVKILSVGKS